MVGGEDRTGVGERAAKEQPRGGPREDVVDLTDVLCTRYGELRMALHFYSGDIDTEAFDLVDGGAVSVAALRGEPERFGEEMVVRVVPGWGVIGGALEC